MDYTSWLEGIKTNDTYEFFHNGPIVRGTNQEHSFKLPTTVKAKSIKVTYKQGRNIILIKDLDINSLKLELTEVDTFKFKPNKETKIQLKIITEEGKIVTSDKFSINVEDSLYDLQLTNNEDLFAIECTVNKFGIKAQEFFKYASATNLKCNFIFDGNWASLLPNVYFKDEYNHYFEVSLKDGVCNIPDKILEKPGLIHVGLRNKSVRSTVWSNPIRIQADCTFIPNNDDDTPVTPVTDTISLYYGAWTDIPSVTTLDGLTEVPDVNIQNLIENGKSLFVKTGYIDGDLHIPQHAVIACDGKLSINEIIVSDLFTLTPWEDYTIVSNSEFNLYYINEKTYDADEDSLKYTLKFIES